MEENKKKIKLWVSIQDKSVAYWDEFAKPHGQYDKIVEIDKYWYDRFIQIQKYAEDSMILFKLALYSEKGDTKEVEEHYKKKDNVTELHDHEGNVHVKGDHQIWRKEMNDGRFDIGTYK